MVYKDGIYLIITPLVIILPITYWYLNLPPEGYCQAENRRLTDQERIEKVVTVVLKNYPQVIHGKQQQNPNLTLLMEVGGCPQIKTMEVDRK